jgi:hypothetical protein
MRPTYILAGVVMLALAAGLKADGEDKRPAGTTDEPPSNNAGKIEGTKWSSVETTVNGTKLPAGAAKLEFGKDRTMTLTVAGQAYKGKYTLGKDDEVKFDFDGEFAGRKSHTEKIVIEKDKLTMTDTDGTTVGFERVK